MRIVALSIGYLNRLNITESAVLLYCRFSLFLKDSISRLFRGRNSCRCFCVELVKLLQCRYFFVYILVLQEYWVLNTTYAVARGVRSFDSFH